MVENKRTPEDYPTIETLEEEKTQKDYPTSVAYVISTVRCIMQ